jgi:hypothetical protein
MARRKESLLQQPWDVLNSSNKRNKRLAHDNTTKSNYNTKKRKKKDIGLMD